MDLNPAPDKHIGAGQLQEIKTEKNEDAASTGDDPLAVAGPCNVKSEVLDENAQCGSSVAAKNETTERAPIKKDWNIIRYEDPDAYMTYLLSDDFVMPKSPTPPPTDNPIYEAEANRRYFAHLKEIEESVTIEAIAVMRNVTPPPSSPIPLRDYKEFLMEVDPNFNEERYKRSLRDPEENTEFSRQMRIKRALMDSDDESNTANDDIDLSMFKDENASDNKEQTPIILKSFLDKSTSVKPENEENDNTITIDIVKSEANTDFMEEDVDLSNEKHQKETTINRGSLESSSVKMEDEDSEAVNEIEGKSTAVKHMYKDEAHLEEITFNRVSDASSTEKKEDEDSSDVNKVEEKTKDDKEEDDDSSSGDVEKTDSDEFISKKSEDKDSANVNEAEESTDVKEENKDQLDEEDLEEITIHGGSDESSTEKIEDEQNTEDVEWENQNELNNNDKDKGEKNANNVDDKNVGFGGNTFRQDDSSDDESSDDSSQEVDIDKDAKVNLDGYLGTTAVYAKSPQEINYCKCIPVVNVRPSYNYIHVTVSYYPMNEHDGELVHYHPCFPEIDIHMDSIVEASAAARRLGASVNNFLKERRTANRPTRTFHLDLHYFLFVNSQMDGPRIWCT